MTVVGNSNEYDDDYDNQYDGLTVVADWVVTIWIRFVPTVQSSTEASRGGRSIFGGILQYKST